MAIDCGERVAGYDAWSDRLHGSEHRGEMIDKTVRRIALAAILCGGMLLSSCAGGAQIAREGATISSEAAEAVCAEDDEQSAAEKAICDVADDIIEEEDAQVATSALDVQMATDGTKEPSRIDGYYSNASWTVAQFGLPQLCDYPDSSLRLFFEGVESLATQQWMTESTWNSLVGDPMACDRTPVTMGGDAIPGMILVTMSSSGDVPSAALSDVPACSSTEWVVACEGYAEVRWALEGDTSPVGTAYMQVREARQGNVDEQVARLSAFYHVFQENSLGWRGITSCPGGMRDCLAELYRDS